TFYTCGPTVYDDAHIGNFRSFLAADLLRRFLESPLCTLTDLDGNERPGPRTVRHVMNITDVGHMTDDGAADGGGEDKMELAAQRLQAAKKAGTVHADADVDPKDPVAISRFYAERFMEDASKLGLKVAIEAAESPKSRTQLMPFATEHIDGMRRVIADLLDSGSAYAAGEPGARAIYFDVSTFPAYGTLSGHTLDQLTAGAGGRVKDSAQSEKRNPADFLLWKEDETHLMKWPAPAHKSCDGWGEGYPGWHIECTAMSLAGLAHTLDAAKARHAVIDLHSGGEDNIFPHHECENAQSCAFTGAKEFARHWFHPRFLMVEGKKMSKSKGTFYTARQLFEQGIEPAALRLELIKTHYRSNADFSMQGLKDSQRRIDRWRIYAKHMVALSQVLLNSVETEPEEGIYRRVKAGLASDLNISAVLAALDERAKSYSDSDDLPQLPSEPGDAASNWAQFDTLPKGSSQRELALLHLIDNILGVIFQPQPKSQAFSIGVFLPGVTPSPEIEQLLLKRADAKKAKDFAAADAIRDELSGRGLAIKDVAGGKVEVGPA
ncbi:MAG: hypothetical protein ACF8Q5_02220, partial [Phycisphaerales bacterium JB040]